VRGYITTPSTCPVAGYWATRINFVWADGTQDDVVAQQPCRP
jgi:hypothetical protein